MNEITFEAIEEYERTNALGPREYDPYDNCYKWAVADFDALPMWLRNNYNTYGEIRYYVNRND